MWQEEEEKKRIEEERIRAQKKAEALQKAKEEKEKREKWLASPEYAALKKKRIKRPIEEVVLDIPATLIQIDDRQIGDRLKEREPSVNVKANAYYMNDREYFINFINSLFNKYSKKLKNTQEDDITCESLSAAKSRDFSLMTHHAKLRLLRFLE